MKEGLGDTSIQKLKLMVKKQQELIKDSKVISSIVCDYNRKPSHSQCLLHKKKKNTCIYLCRLQDPVESAVLSRESFYYNNSFV